MQHHCQLIQALHEQVAFKILVLDPMLDRDREEWSTVGNPCINLEADAKKRAEWVCTQLSACHQPLAAWSCCAASVSVSSCMARNMASPHACSSSSDGGRSVFWMRT